MAARAKSKGQAHCMFHFPNLFCFPLQQAFDRENPSLVKLQGTSIRFNKPSLLLVRVYHNVSCSNRLFSICCVYNT
uniref:Uncharacterized protein n=1 Tax=Setaria italica TaxID=4555 RepID=K3YXC6_SETIT